MNLEGPLGFCTGFARDALDGGVEILVQKQLEFRSPTAKPLSASETSEKGSVNRGAVKMLCLCVLSDVFCRWGCQNADP